MTRLWRELNRRSPALTALAMIHLALLVAFTCALLIDTTQILGISRWTKPAKFAVSTAIYLATIAWLLPATGLSDRTRGRLVALIVRARPPIRELEHRGRRPAHRAFRGPARVAGPAARGCLVRTPCGVRRRSRVDDGDCGAGRTGRDGPTALLGVAAPFDAVTAKA